MDSNITQALQILVIGMGTVFVILSLVVLLSNALIRLVNSYSRPARLTPTSRESVVPPSHIAVIHAVTEHITNGQGSVVSITPIQNQD